MADSVTTDAANDTYRGSRGGVRNIVLWILQIALAAMFVMSGLSKLTAAVAMVALFDAIGIGQWFRFVTGSLELLAAILLLIPAWSGAGATILVAVMTGAVITHLFVVGGSAAVPFALLVAATLVAWGRWERITALRRALFS